MSLRRTSPDLDLEESYRSSMVRHIEQGDWNPVCRDEGLCRRVEDVLRQSSTLLTAATPDLLSEMEESLRAPGTARAGLAGLSKALEVLELAARNLYLYPWRKDFRVVKTYSGTFTHCIKAALSPAQSSRLFGLLGYGNVTTVSGDVELHLTSPPSPEKLLGLAATFFAGGRECLLLRSALQGRGHGAAAELRLVQERRKGHGLPAALDNAGWRGQANLYTAGAAGECFDPPMALRASEMPRPPVASLPTVAEFPEASPDGNQICSCIQDPGSRATECRQCGSVHASTCPALDVCRQLRHLTTHRVLPASGASPPDRQGAPPRLPESHRCVEAGDRGDFVCVDCDVAHDYRCEVPRLCERQGHRVEFRSDALAVSFHACCGASRPASQFACLTCRLFHAPECQEARPCRLGHDVRELGDACGTAGCAGGPHVLCRACFAWYCKDCWYKDPFNCTSGHPYELGSSV
ncbi:spermatogenesis associated 2-like [Denticeps clupeoides]|uniref:Spermatogenesis-associated protein 2 PUB-like domain-containing protein n=1 Tax=Denticeps clupeoides TaxID=299321 RepID=A0AAY4DEX2_9TELE|nr:spermatogenesis-associated protein 2-like protein [Denticeps clupeoides]